VLLEERMCNLCRELDCQIGKCREIESSADDELMREAATSLIRSYEEDKAQLHRTDLGYEDTRTAHKFESR